MRESRGGVVVLGPADVEEALALIGEDPVMNVFAEYRTRLTHLQPRWLGGEMWGYRRGRELISLCHVGSNLVPVHATREACTAFARAAQRKPERTSTVVGPAEAVGWLWEDLAESWPQPRELRWNQPHLQTATMPRVEPDPHVVPTPVEAIDTLYPACVAMYVEEVGVSPEPAGNSDLYRARVSQLVRRGWSFSRIEGGRVVFKAEVACASPSAAQVQGVYVPPDLRGQGRAVSGMAAVLRHCLTEIAPTVSLYVNDHNLAARRAYERVGFVQRGTMSTVMW